MRCPRPSLREPGKLAQRATSGPSGRPGRETATASEERLEWVQRLPRLRAGMEFLASRCSRSRITWRTTSFKKPGASAGGRRSGPPGARRGTGCWAPRPGARAAPPPCRDFPPSSAPGKQELNVGPRVGVAADREQLHPTLRRTDGLVHPAHEGECQAEQPVRCPSSSAVRRVPSYGAGRNPHRPVQRRLTPQRMHWVRTRPSWPGPPRTR